MIDTLLKSKINTIGVSLIGALLIFGLGTLVLGYDAATIAQNTEVTPLVPPKPNPFADLPLEARSAIVYDPEADTVLFNYNSDEALPLASVTKVMTALVASESLSASTVISIDPEALATEGESGLTPGERWQLGDLIDFTLVTSSNDGAKALALSSQTTSGHDFVTAMNQKAGELGLNRSHFWNETGLDLNTNRAGATGSALDVAKLFAYILKSKPELLEATKQSLIATYSLDRIKHSGMNTNSLTHLPGLRASKTGYTDIAGGNLAVAFDRGLRQPIIIVVLGSTEEGRFRDVKKLMSASLAALE